MRTSRYKDDILKVFKTAHVLSIADVCKKIPQADFSTIYRNVEALTKEGILKKIVVTEDLTVYEYADKDHAHDHFICNECGEVEEVHVSHNLLKGKKGKVEEVVLRGTCGDCCS